MINEELSNRIKSVLGYRYTSQILEYLSEKQIFNTLKRPYSRGYISEIVNGTRSNLIVEEAIVELCESKMNQTKILTNRKKELLKKEL